MTGELTGSLTFSASEKTSVYETDISHLAKGIYWIEISAGEKIYREKLTRQ
jgi:hypothetical protein